jgi:LCP family protein required for cell wall assembly
METIVTRSKKVNKKMILLSKIKRRLLKHIWAVRISLVILSAVAIYLLILLLGLFFRRVGFTNYSQMLVNFILTPQDKIETIDQRTNIVLLGKPGEGNVAPDLVDSIIFISISHENPSITLISLPRDIWIPELRAKLNSTYYWGEQKKEGGGLLLTKSTVEEIIGKPVHYALVIDFSGFVKIVDVLGGIELEVERSFEDNKYPIKGHEADDCGGDPEYRCRYETVKFAKGHQLMDGETALKFARSRNAEGDEGTDLARSVRQQKVIKAIIMRVVSVKILLHPKKAFEVWDVIKSSVRTDIPSDSAAILIRRIIQAKDNIKSLVLSEEFLTNPDPSLKYDNLYVFIPKNGNWNEVHEWAKDILR